MHSKLANHRRATIDNTGGGPGWHRCRAMRQLQGSTALGSENDADLVGLGTGWGGSVQAVSLLAIGSDGGQGLSALFVVERTQWEHGDVGGGGRRL